MDSRWGAIWQINPKTHHKSKKTTEAVAGFETADSSRGRFSCRCLEVVAGLPGAPPVFAVPSARAYSSLQHHTFQTQASTHLVTPIRPITSASALTRKSTALQWTQQSMRGARVSYQDQPDRLCGRLNRGRSPFFAGWRSLYRGKRWYCLQGWHNGWWYAYFYASDCIYC